MFVLYGAGRYILGINRVYSGFWVSLLDVKKRGRGRASSLGDWGRGYRRETSFLDGHRSEMGNSGNSRGFFASLLVWSARFLGVGLMLSVFWVAFFAIIPVPATPLMFLRAGNNALNGQTPIWKKDWVSMDSISPRLQSAVIAAEDARFLEHNGFDFDAIDKALRHNQNQTRRIRGGSTISQQVAKNVFLWPDRSWVRKGIETYFTVLIELLWSKRRILEVYLNVVEFGDGVYGAEAASQAFFKKPAAKLNSPEAALLAAVLPNPRRFLVSRPSGYIRFRQSMIQRRIRSVSIP